jgi:hypothetical protein
MHLFTYTFYVLCTMSIAWGAVDYVHDNALSKLQIPFAAGSGMGITVSSMGKLSYQRAYRSVQGSGSDLKGVTFPLLMAIIHVDLGEVTGVTWVCRSVTRSVLCIFVFIAGSCCVFRAIIKYRTTHAAGVIQTSAARV